MAKKTKHDLDDLELDRFGDDFDLDPEAPPKDDRHPVVKIGASALNQVGTKKFATSFFKKLILAALPKSYSDAYDNTGKLIGEGKELYNNVKKEVLPTTREFAKAVDRANPKLKKKLPKKLQDQFKEITEQQMGSGSRGTVDATSSAVTAMLAQTFQFQVADALERDKKAEAKETVSLATDKIRNENQVKQLNAIREALTRHNGYQENITNNFQRKSLELQYRQYMNSRDLLDVTKAMAVAQDAKLADIVKNTGLPDYLKLHTSEAIRQMAREKLVGKAQDRVGAAVKGFGGRVLNKVRGKVMEKARGIGESMRTATDALNSASEMGEMMGDMGLDPNQVKIDILGGLIAEIGGTALSNKLKPYLARHVGKIDRVTKTGLDLAYYTGNAGGLINQYAKSGTSFGSRLPWLQDALKEAIGTYRGQDDSLLAGGMEGSTGATYYDNLSRQSLTEIIPGYLSRILHSVDVMRTGDTKYPRTVFNFDKNTFTSSAQAQSNAAERILGTKRLGDMSARSDDFMAQIDPEGKLTPAQRQILSKHLYDEIAKGNTAFDPKMITNAVLFQEGSEEDRRAISQFARSRFNYSPTGDRGPETIGTKTLRNSLSSRMSGMAGAFPMLNEDSNRYISAGQRDMLIQMGIIDPTTDGTKLSTSYVMEQYQRHLRGEGPAPTDYQDMFAGGGPGQPRPPTPPVPGPTGPTGEPAGFSNAGNNNRTVAKHLKSILDALANKATTEGQGIQTDVLNEILMGITGLSALIAEGGFGGGSGGGGPGGGGDPAAGKGFRNRLKQVAGRVGRGLQWAGGKYMDFNRAYWGALGTAGKGLVNAAVGTTRFAAGLAFGRTKGFVGDLFLPGATEPIITQAKLEAGEYFDALSGKVVNRVEDIKGALKDREGNFVLSLADFKKGLRDKEGKRVKVGFLGRALSGAWNVASRLGGGWMAVTKAFWGIPITLAKKTLGLAASIINPVVDIYVKGEALPRLQANLMKTGYYMSARSGKPILKYTDIDGDVKNAEGDTILTVADMARGLVDKRGRELQGLTGKILSLTRKSLGFVGNLGKKAVVGGFNLMKRGFNFSKGLLTNGVKAGTGLLKGLLGRGQRGKGGGTGDGASVPLLAAIYDLLVERLKPQKAPRKGSWQEKANRAKPTGKSIADTFTKEEKESNPVLRALLWIGGTIGGLATGAKMFFKNMLSSMRMMGGGMMGGAKAVGVGLLADAFIREEDSILGKMAGEYAIGRWAMETEIVIPDGNTPMMDSYLLRKLRYAQYGVNLNDGSQTSDIALLERAMAEHLVISGKTAHLDGKIKLRRLMRFFDRDPDSEAETAVFTTWFTKRFQPVFLKWQEVLLGFKAGANLLDVDKEIQDSSKVEFAKATAIKSGAKPFPYDVTESPFRNTVSTTGMSVINACMDAIVAKFGKVAIKAPDAINKTTGKKDVQLEAAIAKARSEGKSGLTGIGLNYNSDKATIGADGKIIKTSSLPGVKFDTNRELDNLTSVRLKCYGFIAFDVVQVNAVFALEQVVLRDIKFNSRGEAEFQGKAREYFRNHCAEFGIVDSPYWDDRWTGWFENRFLPVFLLYSAGVFALSGSGDPIELAKRLRPAQKLEIATKLIGAKYHKFAGIYVSIWGTYTWPFREGEVNRDSAHTDSDLNSLKALASGDSEYKTTNNLKTLGAELTKSLATIGGGKTPDQLTGGNPNEGPSNATGGSNTTVNSVQTGDGGGAPPGSGGGWSTNPPAGSSGDVTGNVGTKPNLKGNQKKNADLMFAYAKSQGLEGEELALFMGQVSHESGNFIYNQEIASGAAYEGRTDLGNTQKGDGVRFKGRGWIQITGRSNYARYGKMLGLDLVANPELAEDPEVARKLAILYWMDRVRPRFAKTGMNIESATRAINGGTNGLKDRIERTEQWRAVVKDWKNTAETGATNTASAGGGAVGGTAGTAPTGATGAPPTGTQSGSAGPVQPGTAPASTGSAPAEIGTGPGGYMGNNSGGGSSGGATPVSGPTPQIGGLAPGPGPGTTIPADAPKGGAAGAETGETAPEVPTFDAGGQAGSSAGSGAPGGFSSTGGFGGNADSPATVSATATNQQAQSSALGTQGGNVEALLTEQINIQRSMATSLSSIDTTIRSMSEMGMAAMKQEREGGGMAKASSPGIAGPIKMLKKLYN